MSNSAEANNLKILLLVVLYKTDVLDSETIKTIQNQKQSDAITEIIIWDNSPEAIDDSRLQLVKEILGNCIYISTPENTSLSKLYNHVITNYHFDYILLLDQDTGIPENYFNEILQYVKHFPDINLFLPIVKNDNLIVSPGSFRYFKGKHWDSPISGLISSKNTLAVTSGMLISWNYFAKHNYRFDERLNLYGIDTKFMLDYAKKEKTLFVSPIAFAHNSALWSNPPADELLPRFKNFKKAWSLILSDRPIANFLNLLHSKYSSIKLAIKYKDLRFLS